MGGCSGSLQVALSSVAPCPFRSHLRQSVHVDRRSLADVLVFHRLEQIDRASEIALNRRARRVVVEALDFIECVHVEAPEIRLRSAHYNGGRMSLREFRRHVGRLAIVGFTGHAVPAGLRELVTEFDLGGVVYFARNIVDPDQVAELSSEVAALARDWPLWIAVDQEGRPCRAAQGALHRVASGV